jgi:CHASE1-domain containing sensor protein
MDFTRYNRIVDHMATRVGLVLAGFGVWLALAISLISAA